MRKLDDIPKKQIFHVPEGYFEDLPLRIQTRVAQTKATTHSMRTLRRGWRLAFAAIIVIGTVVFFLRRPSPKDAESILATVETQDLIEYLQEVDLTTDDLVESLEFNAADVEAIENQVYDLPLQNNETTPEWDSPSL